MVCKRCTSSSCFVDERRDLFGWYGVVSRSCIYTGALSCNADDLFDDCHTCSFLKIPWLNILTLVILWSCFSDNSFPGCADSVHELSGASGELVSPNFGTGDYPSMADCYYKITVAAGKVSRAIHRVQIIMPHYQCLTSNFIACNGVIPEDEVGEKHKFWGKVWWGWKW